MHIRAINSKIGNLTVPPLLRQEYYIILGYLKLQVKMAECFVLYHVFVFLSIMIIISSGIMVIHQSVESQSQSHYGHWNKGTF